jgi:hypothetical protein
MREVEGLVGAVELERMRVELEGFLRRELRNERITVSGEYFAKALQRGRATQVPIGDGLEVTVTGKELGRLSVVLPVSSGSALPSEPRRRGRPTWFERLSLFLPSSVREPLLGDLRELKERLERRGHSRREVNRAIKAEVFWSLAQALRNTAGSCVGQVFSVLVNWILRTPPP